MKLFFKNLFIFCSIFCCISLSSNVANAQTACFDNGECTCEVTITVTATGNWSGILGRLGAGICDNPSGSAGVSTFTYSVEASPTGGITYSFLAFGTSVTNVQITGCGININQQGSGAVPFKPIQCGGTEDCCAPPTNLTVVQVDETSVKVCADPSPAECGAFNYFVRFRIAGTSTWTDLGGSNDNCRQAGPLAPCTEYEFQMYSWTEVCDDTSEPSASVFFTTDCLGCCDAPENLTVTSDPANPAFPTVCADPPSAECGDFEYYLRWRPVGTTAWLDIGGTNDNCRQSGPLEPCTEYEFQMYAFTDVCNDFSDPSESVFFTTDCPTDCCAAPTNLTVTADPQNLTAVTVCADPSPAECGEFDYFLRFRPVGTLAWLDIGGTNDICRIAGPLDLCTEYEFQMYAWNEVCNDISEVSESVFFTTDCIELCCSAPANVSVTLTQADQVEVCSDPVPEACGEAFYFVRFREVGVLPWTDFGGINNECRTIGDLLPCTDYEFQMYTWNEGCNNISDFSESVFISTDCEGTPCFDNSNCTCQLVVTITPLVNAPWTGTIGRPGFGFCENINGPAGESVSFIYNVDANVTYGFFPTGGFVPFNITITGCGLNIDVDVTNSGLFSFMPVQDCLGGNGANNRLDIEAEIAAIEAGAWGAVYSSVTITPNPANDWLEITTTSNTATYHELIDINGKVVAQTIIESNGSAQVDVNQLATGIYILRTTNRQSGELIASEKVIIKH